MDNIVGRCEDCMFYRKLLRLSSGKGICKRFPPTIYYDTSGNLVFGDPNEQVHEMYNTLDDLLEETSKTCRTPTSENPFMNPTVDDFNTEAPAACNELDEEINEGSKVDFNDDLYQDVDDVWEVKNSQRQFQVIPDTGIPNNQKAFAEWLYNTHL